MCFPGNRWTYLTSDTTVNRTEKQVCFLKYLQKSKKEVTSSSVSNSKATTFQKGSPQCGGLLVRSYMSRVP